jgi:hypothetical protein
MGQRFPVRVKFVTYAGTMQETCLRLMGKKMLVALMMEGKFSGEGPQALDTDEDLMSAMARELVEKAGVGESANAVWRELDLEREKVQPRPVAVEAEVEEDSAPILNCLSSQRRSLCRCLRNAPDGAAFEGQEAQKAVSVADGHRTEIAAQSLRVSCAKP